MGWAWAVPAVVIGSVALSVLRCASGGAYAVPMARYVSLWLSHGSVCAFVCGVCMAVVLP